MNRSSVHVSSFCPYTYVHILDGVIMLHVRMYVYANIGTPGIDEDDIRTCVSYALSSLVRAR